MATQSNPDTAQAGGNHAVKLRVLVACEYSGKVREAYRKLGHDAWSCDLLPADDNSPYHIQGDVLQILEQGWDLMIAHPPCTYLTNSGVRWLYSEPERWKDLIDGAVFFRTLLHAPIHMIAVENPIMHKYAKQIVGVPQSQIIQPWQFGHGETKATCLWLKNLPPLEPTDIVEGRHGKVWRMAPSEDRWKLRSETYQGIADAMSQQWGSDLVGTNSYSTAGVANPPQPTPDTSTAELSFEKRLRQILTSYWPYDRHMSEKDSKQFWGAMEEQIIATFTAHTQQLIAEFEGQQGGLAQSATPKAGSNQADNPIVAKYAGRRLTTDEVAEVRTAIDKAIKEYENIKYETGGDYILFKWGSLKGWELHSEKGKKLSDEYLKHGRSMNAMSQKDDKRQKEIILEMIDECDGTIQSDWSGEYFTKAAAREYITGYDS